MNTTVYFVRHAKAPFRIEDFHDRKLSEEGREDALLVYQALRKIGFDCLISSSSPRALETIRPLAKASGKDVESYDELREFVLRGPEFSLSEDEVLPALEKAFAYKDQSLPGGQSQNEYCDSSVAFARTLFEVHEGETICFGTHGIAMTLILASYDPSIGFLFWKQLTKPDIYRAEIENDQLIDLARIPF